MKYSKAEIEDIIILEPDVFFDDRGYFFESFKQKEFNEYLGSKIDFCQENESKSFFGVLRGLHYQLPPFEQAKLVRVIKGSVIDVAVDIRKDSPTFGKHIAVELNDENKKQLFIPKGFAHGFVVLSEFVIFSYRVDNDYNAKYERGIAFNDPRLNINWLLKHSDIRVSTKDRNNPTLISSSKNSKKQ